MHEVLHALGYWHEQSRPDRDRYVEIFWEHITSGNQHNFNKQRSSNTQNLTYDYDSIMHYGNHAFSKNGKPTIQAIGDPNKQLGQRTKLSPLDIAGLNKLYNCEKSTKTGISDWSAWTSCHISCDKIRQRFCFHDSCSNTDYFGVETENGKCTDAECNAPLDGHWNRWSSWDSCSITCGTGTKKRTRQCQDPAPKNNGRMCVGSATDITPCSMRPCGLGPYDTEFEYGLGKWQDIGLRKWAIHQGKTPSSMTGPNNDHTRGDKTGHYLYFEASAPSKRGDTATLQLTKPADTKRKECLDFYYSMYGSGIGSLEVILSGRPVWRIGGDQGTEWKHQVIELPTTNPVKIALRATRGPDFRADIALDDLRIKEC
ncbi:uncharacterized protein LOC141907576 [Tubulanus polymorphus]|uniref:uncharacterized protein LOC141907576 n=1 Tax=Tubulanus polymorphus TaxID=672921 RepID=UPI003DA6CDDF